ncbi:PAS domain S-box protein [Phyllobacterium sp. 21LDTY02-6]|uniref:PAS domain S-box protein n=1 Tax=Phyllobacterium sp. 21LDTY02-6 TaxID=2944903 RepID=UPI002021CF49|nr:PAS domain S-box protein [Phyllobacterium sp. 21LDTY02-6]
MASGTYPFIDIAVLDEIRERFANGDALIVFSPDLANVIWANGEGAAALGYSSVDDVLGSETVLGVQARRQLMALDNFPAIGHGRTVSLRLDFGLSSRMHTFQASDLTLPRGESAILLSIAKGQRDASMAQNASLAIRGFGDETTHAAMIDGQGIVLASTRQFARLGFSDKSLADLVREVRLERNRLVKRPVSTPRGAIPTGIARLTDSPALHLLFAIDDRAVEADASGPESNPVRSEAAAPTTPASQASLPLDDMAGPPAASVSEPDQPLPDQHNEPTARFVWKVDANGAFTEISPEFARAVGPAAADVIGKTFREICMLHAIEDKERVAELLERRDTWSGRTVFWPMENGDKRVPVELAALPIYSREREFLGFRGFGIVRLSEAVQAQSPLMTEPEDAAETVVEEPAALEQIAREAAEPSPTDGELSNVVTLKGQRLPRDEGRLNEAERNAFREIAERLRREVLAEPTPAENAVPEVPDAEIVGPGFAKPAASEPKQDFAEEIRHHARRGVDTTILAALPLPVLIHREGNVVYANRAMLDLTGHESPEAVNAAGGLSALFAENAEGHGDPHEIGGMPLRRSDGSVSRVEAHLQAVQWSGEGGETEHRALLLALSPHQEGGELAEEERRSLQTRIDELSTILDTATDGVILLDSSGSIRSVNHSAAALFAYEPDEIVGKNFSLLFAVESQRAAMDYLNSLSDNGVASLLNDGREVIGRESRGRFIPLFMTIGRLDASKGYCVVLRDITHWKRAEEELVNATKEAERTSAQKSEFLARISHEIRTPLNAIIGFSELMADEKFGPIGSERYRDYLHDISRSGNHVLSLVNDLLDISKIEAGAVEMNFEAVPLNDVLTEAVAIMQPQANRERVIIRSSLMSRLPDIVADHRSITQIALNLLSNAVRFTGPGGQVIVSTSYEPGGDVLLRVRDTGIGMTRQEVEQALRPYKQITTPANVRPGGTGLGLPLTKAMAEANRASFNIDSSPGRGTMVEISFPSTRVLAE